MSFFKKMLSSVGIGSAKVDTILQEEHFVPGQVMAAVVKVTGGSTEQEIDGLYFAINATYETTQEVEVEGEDGEKETHEETVSRTVMLAESNISEAFVVGPGEEKEIPVSLGLPFHTPLSLGAVSVWVRTGLDIKRAIDPGDRDEIKVAAGDAVGALFHALDALGFDLSEAECEDAPRGFPGNLPMVQEFEFKPVSGPFRGRLDELEAVCLPKPGGMELFLEMDRKARGLSGFIAELTGTDETRIRLSIGSGDLPNLTQILRETIDQHC